MSPAGRPVAALLLTLATAPAWAGNFIAIDAGSDGSVTNLTIVQDSTAGNNTNTVNGPSGGTTPFTAQGAWKTLSINQSGGNNILSGAIATGAAAPGTNSFVASYAGGNNSHTVTLGGSTPPSSAAVTVAVTNTAPATAANTIQETLDTPAALTDGLTVNGTGNRLTNAVAAGGAITLNTIIGDGGTNGTASFNTVGNSASGLAGAYNGTVTISGDGVTMGMNNIVQNPATGAGDRSFDVTLTGTSGGVVYNALTGGAGTVSQSSSVTIDSASTVRYAVQSAATGTSSVTATLNNVSGGVYVQQDSGASNAAVNLTVNGGGYTLGTLGALPTGMTTTGLPGNFFGTGGANPGVAVYQNSATPITVTVAPTSTGYTAAITHSP